MQAVQSSSCTGMAGLLAKLEAGCAEPFTAQVKSLNEKANKSYKASLSVGARTVDAALASQLSELVQAGEMKVGSTIKVKAYTLVHKDDAKNIILLSVTDLEVLSSAKVMPLGDATATINCNTPAVIKTSGAARKLETPPEPSPSEEPAAKFSKTPQGRVPRPAENLTPPTPAQSTPSISHQTKGLVPFSFINPYNSEQACKAKVSKKFPLRQLNSSKKLMMEFVDAEGTQIQGTFWREAADKYDEQMKEGAVYILRKFQVKPANKQYSTVMNDYELHFNDKSVIEEFADQSAAETMSAVVHIVPIPKLPHFVSRKAPVDVLGVVTGMGETSTVKRKSDMSEFTKRELTITDKSCKTVTLTLWGDNAVTSEGEVIEGMVVQATACKVGDYNGCTLSTLSRSQVTFNPDTPAATELSNWWQSEGQTATLVPVSEASSKSPGGKGDTTNNRNQLHLLEVATSQQVPEDGARPTYHNVLCVSMYINPDQTMYYLANPQSGKKVVERDGQYMDSDGKVIDTASYRYVMQLKVADLSGPAYISCFNEQAEMILGTSADHLAELRAKDEAAYKAQLASAQWCEWRMTVQTKGQEYKGERRLRHQAYSLRPVNYAEDGHRLLEAIHSYGV